MIVASLFRRLQDRIVPLLTSLSSAILRSVLDPTSSNNSLVSSSLRRNRV